MGWKGSIVEVPLYVANRFLRKGISVRRRPHKILVFRSSDLGDLLTTTPIFDALRRRFPESQIVGVIGRWARDILANNPYINDVLFLDVPWNNKMVPDQSWRAVMRFLRSSPDVLSVRGRGGFDIGIDVMGSHVGAVLMMRLGVRYRVGVRGYRGGWSACQRYIRFSDQRSVAAAALEQAALLGATDLPEARPQLFLTDAERAEAAGRWGPRRAGVRRVLVGCGGGIAEKCWAAGELGRALNELAGRPIEGCAGLDLIVVGGPGDRERGVEVLRAARPLHLRSVCGDVSLRQTFALCEQADLVTTPPSMLLHVAAAFRRPTVVVLGGLYRDGVAHDRMWGYPPPYLSVAPAVGSRADWPEREQFVEAMAGQLKAHVG